MVTQRVNIEIEFRGGNREIIAAKDPDVMIVGPAGTGKTVACCWKIHFICQKYPNARVLMARKTQEALKTGALATYMKTNPEQFGISTYGGSKHHPAEIRYPNGSVILSVGMDKADKVLSTEFDVIYVNEATEISESDWETLRARLRNGVVPYQMIFGDLNPSGVRHWANLRMQKGLTRKITSLHRDNPAFYDLNLVDPKTGEKGYWTDLGNQYINTTLQGLTGARRKRLLDGLWASAEGVVYDSFDPQVHVIDDNKAPDTTGWRCAMGVDVGTKNPTCILTVYQNPQNNYTFVAREFYQRGMSSNRILRAVMEEADRVHPDFIAVDPSAVAYILDLQSAGYPAYPADNNILTGIQQVKTILEAVTEPEIDDEGNEILELENGDMWQPEPLFGVSDMCQNLIEEFGMYAFPDGARIENDKPVKEHDHSMDALRYVCTQLFIPHVEIGLR